MKGNVLEAVIGAVVLVVASFFIYFACISEGEKINDGYVLVARFDDVSGLAQGADVKLNGIKIGIVRSLKIDENYQARAELLLKNPVKIPCDSSAEIVTEGIIGSKFVAMNPGFSEKKFAEGDEIELTKSSLNLERLIDKFIINSSAKKPEE
ncbi:ATPase AAA [Alphaproteobacteria bacterium]|nr:ATPase AAA [Alphaproteobacteria bacterium]